MRIAVLAHLRHPIAPPFMGGMEAHCWHLVRGLAARGHEVTLFATGDSRAGGRLFAVLPRHYDAECPLPDSDALPAFYRRLDRAVATACDALSKGGFDVIHNNTLHRYPPQLAHQKRLACVTSLHIPPFPVLHQAVLHSAAPWSRFTVTSRRQLASWWGDAPPPEAAVVHNGIDPALWPFSPQGDGSLVWAGRLTPNKGAHLAVRAAALLGRRLTLFGAIEDPAYFAGQIHPLLTPDIRYGGHLPGQGLARAFGRASALLFTPLWDEPFGLTAIEAMACGTPVAALDRGAAREVVGDAGSIAPLSTPEALATAAVAALAMPRAIPRARVAACFTLDAMIDGYERQYRAAIAAAALATPVADRACAQRG